MKLALIGSISLALLAIGKLQFPPDPSIPCSILMDLKPCSILPSFTGCATDESSSIPANLTRWFYDEKLEHRLPDRFRTLRYLAARRFQFQPMYNRRDRSVGVRLMADKCCKHPKATLAIEYRRQRLSTEDSCPTLSYESSDPSLRCVPLFLGLFSVLLAGNVILMQGQSFALVLSTARHPEEELRWIEQLVEFGMWTGEDIRNESVSEEESCSCSALREFKGWHQNCQWVSQIPSNGSRPKYNLTMDPKVEERPGLSTLDQWIILGVVCGLLMLVGVMMDRGGPRPGTS